MISVKLPSMLEELNRAWAKIPMGQLSGLAPINQGGPQDKCIIDGVWSPALQAAHGGPIPMLAGAPKSRGIAEAWPYSKTSWAQVGHSNWKKVGGFISQENPVEGSQWRRNAGASWAEMDWRGNKFGTARGGSFQEQQKESWNWNEPANKEEAYEGGSFRRDAAGTKMRRTLKKNPQEEKGRREKTQKRS